MKYSLNFDHWTVLYASGHKRFFKTREAAIAEAVLHGIGIRPPLFVDA